MSLTHLRSSYMHTGHIPDYLICARQKSPAWRVRTPRRELQRPLAFTLFIQPPIGISIAALDNDSYTKYQRRPSKLLQYNYRIAQVYRWNFVDTDGESVTDVSRWVCCCPASLIGIFLFCKHLVRESVDEKRTQERLASLSRPARLVAAGVLTTMVRPEAFDVYSVLSLRPGRKSFVSFVSFVQQSSLVRRR
jgi:hypothetical protein